MKHYFDFNGVTKRQEYWAIILLSFLGMALGMTLTIDENILSLLIALAVLIGTFWLILATTVRRLRDAGLNTWWILVTLIPYIGTVATIVFGCIPTAINEDKQ